MAFVSPGVFTRIIDLSEYVRNVPATIAFLPIISERGPDNQLVFTNARDFYHDFGEPDITYGGREFSQGPYVADSFLKESDSLYVVRCLPQDASYSNLSIAVQRPEAADGTANTIVESIAGRSTDNAITTFLGTSSELSGDGYDAGDYVGAVTFYGVGRGEWYNRFAIDITKPRNQVEREENPDLYILDIYQQQTALDFDGNIRFEIIESYKVSFDPTKMDDAGETMWVEDVINNYSRYIRCQADPDSCREALEDNVDFSEQFTGGPTFNYIQFGGGSSGELFDQANGRFDRVVASQLLAQAYSATLIKTNGDQLTEVRNTEDYYFNVVFDGGYPDVTATGGVADVKNAAFELANTLRRDCIAILDNGDNTTVTQALARRNDNAYNSRYAAVYESYTKIYDAYSGKNIWITPVYHMARIIPYVDKTTELWYAPAGFNRATISGIRDIRFSPNLSERDQFYLNQINPIVKFNVGYTVYGQLTTQRRPTALQDINVIRLVLYVQKALEEFCKFYIFEHNDQATWAAINNNVSQFLKSVQDRRGLYGFSVSVFASDYDIKAKRVNVNVTLRPVRVIEQIHLNFFIR